MANVAQIRKERELKQLEKYKDYVTQHTKEYIEQYLNPDLFFIKGTSVENKIECIMYDVDIDNKVIYNYILNMSYKDFLDTPYWEGITLFIKKRAGYKCEKCNKSGILDVHHKTYINHGQEHIKSIARNDLILLCRECHEKEHHIKNEEV